MPASCSYCPHTPQTHAWWVYTFPTWGRARATCLTHTGRAVPFCRFHLVRATPTTTCLLPQCHILPPPPHHHHLCPPPGLTHRAHPTTAYRPACYLPAPLRPTHPPPRRVHLTCALTVTAPGWLYTASPLLCHGYPPARRVRSTLPDTPDRRRRLLPRREPRLHGWWLMPHTLPTTAYTCLPAYCTTRLFAPTRCVPPFTLQRLAGLH